MWSVASDLTRKNNNLSSEIMLKEEKAITFFMHIHTSRKSNVWLLFWYNIICAISIPIMLLNVWRRKNCAIDYYIFLGSCNNKKKLKDYLIENSFGGYGTVAWADIN